MSAPNNKQARSRAGSTALACILALAVHAPATAQDPPLDPEVRALLDRWSDRVRGLETLRVEFEQVKTLRFLKTPLRSKGTTLLLGRKLLMQVRDTKGKLETELLVTPDELKIHYPTLKKLEIYPSDRTRRRRSPFPLMVDDIDALPVENDLVLTREDGHDVLEVTPKPDPDEKKTKRRGDGAEKVLLRFDDGVLVGVTQFGRRGTRVDMNILEFEKNAKVDPEALRIEVPEGTETVRIGKPPEDGKEKGGGEAGGGPVGPGGGGSGSGKGKGTGKGGGGEDGRGKEPR